MDRDKALLDWNRESRGITLLAFAICTTKELIRSYPKYLDDTLFCISYFHIRKSTWFRRI